MENKNILNDSDLENVSGGEVVISKMPVSDGYREYKVTVPFGEAGETELNMERIYYDNDNNNFDGDYSTLYITKQAVPHLTQRLQNCRVKYRIEE